MTRVLLLGADGMLGFAMQKVLSSDESIELVATSKSDLEATIHFEWTENGQVAKLIETIKPNFVINCIGRIPQRVAADTSSGAYDVNIALPQEIARVCEEIEATAIEIATDCVFSGSEGPFSEESPRLPTDLYGLSKLSGEISSKSVVTLRCSIIGVRPNDDYSLVGWLLSQPRYSEVRGFTNHLWNGITTLAYAKIVLGLIRSGSQIHTGKTLHVLPRDEASKFELLNIVAVQFNRRDIKIIPHETLDVIDRRLATLWAKENIRLWIGAGYPNVPSIRELIEEMRDWYRTISPRIDEYH